MSRVFLLSTIAGTGKEIEQVNVILRHLASRGNDVTLYDMSVFANPDRFDAEDIKKQMNLLDIYQAVRTADAVVLVTDEYCAYLTQQIQSLFTTSKRFKRSSSVWFHNGICCTILGGSVKKSRVAKQLWEVFSEQNELDLTDIFPYGSPRPYVLDYTKETAQPTVF